VVISRKDARSHDKQAIEAHVKSNTVWTDIELRCYNKATIYIDEPKHIRNKITDEIVRLYREAGWKVTVDKLWCCLLCGMYRIEIT